MTTQPKRELESPQSNQNHHGPFYRSTELVTAVHRAEGGMFEGFRAAHAFGRIYAGTFTATPVAKTISRAAHFQGAPVPVTARLSGSSGDPAKPPLSIVAMATKFYLPDGTVTDLIAITLPAFFALGPLKSFLRSPRPKHRTRRQASPISPNSKPSRPATRMAPRSSRC